MKFQSIPLPPREAPSEGAQPYSAIVYYDNPHVVARNSKGSLIDSGIAYEDDEKVIQSAIDSLSEGLVLVRGVDPTTVSVTEKDEVKVAFYYQGIPRYTSVRTENISNIHEYYVTTLTELNDAFSEIRSNGYKAVVKGDLNTVITVTSPLNPPSNVKLLRLNLKAKDELNDSVIETDGETDILVSECIIDGNVSNQTYTGNRADHIAVKLQNGSDLHVEKCHIFDVMAGACIGLMGSDRVSARFNYLRPNTSELCDGVFQNSNDVVIEGNVVHDAGDCGFGNDSGSRAVVRGNTVYNPTYMGVAVQDYTYMVIADNVIQSPGGHGIQVYGNSVKPVITGNKVHHAGFTQSAGQGIETKVSYATISGNNVDDVYTNGISIKGNGVVCSGNYVSRAGATGINVIDNFNRATVTGNISINNGQRGVIPFGIRLSTNNQDCSISGNICYDNQSTKTQDYGIMEETDGDYNVITGNNVRGNATGGLSISGANTLYQTATDGDPLNIT